MFGHVTVDTSAKSASSEASIANMAPIKRIEHEGVRDCHKNEFCCVRMGINIP